ncbi:MAG: hypothetical protein IJL46_01130 [Clostridia bacterium]|nr:hypothetical protein [Clostridia bacterium]MBQ5956154.1 hypothetical protein [Clostridia bacterium]MBQ6004452.1 hypothetical protein [Clostridia bacterium]
MKKYVAYKDLSKKEKKKRDRERRVTWEGIRPVTRVKESGKLYSRKKRRKDDRKLMNEEHESHPFFMPFLSKSIILDSCSYMRKIAD